LALVKVAEVTIYGMECPIAKGPADLKYDIKLSSILPPALGDANFHFAANDAMGNEVACIQAKLSIQLEDSSNNAETAIATEPVARVGTATESSEGSKIASAEMDTEVAQVTPGLNESLMTCLPDQHVCADWYQGSRTNCIWNCCLCREQTRQGKRESELDCYYSMGIEYGVDQLNCGPHSMQNVQGTMVV